MIKIINRDPLLFLLWILLGIGIIFLLTTTIILSDNESETDKCRQKYGQNYIYYDNTRNLRTLCRSLEDGSIKAL